MNARLLGKLAAFVTLAASGAYVFIYLYRWEWNRAQMSAAIFIAAEVGLMGWLLTDRLRRLERRLDHAALAAEQRRVQILRRTAQPAYNFKWLVRPEHTNVFIPVLLGAGAVLSGLAWIVERSPRRRPDVPPSTDWRVSWASSSCRVAACSMGASTHSHCCGDRGDETGHRLPRARRRHRRGNRRTDGRDAEPARRSAPRLVEHTRVHGVDPRLPGRRADRRSNAHGRVAATVDDATISVPARAHEAADELTVRGM